MIKGKLVLIPCWCWLMICSVAIDAQGRDHPSSTSLIYADIAQAQQVLGSWDLYLQSLSPMDRAVRMRTVEQVDDEAIIDHFKNAARAWNLDEMDVLNRQWSELSAHLEGYKSHLPPEIWMIKTDGSEEGGASVAYTRGTAIIFSVPVLGMDPRELRDMLCHELFHVISRTNPQLRDRLFEIVGFQRLSGLVLPRDLGARIITNPDSPTISHRVGFKLGNTFVNAVPIFMVSEKLVDAVNADDLFFYLRVRLLVIDEVGHDWVVRFSEGSPVFLDPLQSPEILRQLKINTDYVLAVQPEEAMAENFVHLINANRSVAYPDVLKSMDRILREALSEGD